jgi:hypothetical protein
MSLDPSTTQAYANVFGGGLSGAIIFVSLAANAWQFILARRDRARADSALEAANAAHLATAKSVTGVAQELILAVDKLGRRRQASPVKQVLP